MNRICNEEPPSLPEDKWSPEFVDFIHKCLVKDVKERWDVKQLMEVSDCEMVKGIASICEGTDRRNQKIRQV